MEALAKSVQQAQAAVLDVQDDLALLRAQLEADDAGLTTGAASAPAANPYYVDLQSCIQQKQEAASQLLQSSTHIFYEQFNKLEEKAVRLDNVHQKEKELQAAKKSMQRYFDAHATELMETRDAHAGAMRLELVKREHLEEGAADERLSHHKLHLAHHVMLVWMKKAMIRNLTREYMSRQSTTRQTYQEVACAALARQRSVATQQRLFCKWRSRFHTRQLKRLEEAVVESEKRAHFFRQELATAQQTLHDRLGAALQERHHTNVEVSGLTTAVAATKNTASPFLSKDTAAHENEVQRLRTALEEMTLEFSERTGTYIRQQEHLEQLFWSKEQKMRESIVGLQADLCKEQKARQACVTQHNIFVEQVNAYWAGKMRDCEAVVERKEEFAHYALLGLVGRLRHHQRMLQDEAAKLANEVNTLAPLGERCLKLENQAALSDQLLQKAKAKSRESEKRANADHIVGEVLTDRVVHAHNTALRARYFAQWMRHSSARALTTAQVEVQEMKAALQRQRQQLVIQQQESSSRHQTEVAQLRNDLEQLRRTNVRLQSEIDTIVKAQRERETALYDSEVKNGDLAAALLREKMERRGVDDKWWCTRAESVVLAESQARCRMESQESRWWAALQQRESVALKVWTASLHYDATQLTAVCEGWEAHCRDLETQHEEKRRVAASRQACALERAHLHSQTLAQWMLWKTWAQHRFAVRILESNCSNTKKELVERHGNELARLHASHDVAHRRQRQELVEEKTQLQSIHQDRIEKRRRVQAEEQARQEEQHRQQLAIIHAAHAASIEEREEAVRQLHSQLEDLGAVVVEYCAAATFARWQCWTVTRQTHRTARQQRGFLLRVHQWHATASHAAEDALTEKEKLFAAAITHATREHEAAHHRHTQRLSHERELHEAQLRKVECAMEAAEKEAVHLRGELHHVRGLYDAEKRYAEEALQAAAEERRDHRTALALTTRLAEWREGSHRLVWEQQRAMTRLFEDAAAEVLCDVAIDAQTLREIYVEALKAHEATRKLLRQATAEKTRQEEMRDEAVQRHGALAKAHAEATKEVAQLTHTLEALVQEHEAARDELAGARAEKEAAVVAHAALSKDHAAVRHDVEVLKAEAAEVQNAFAAYVKEHKKTRVDAAVQMRPDPTLASSASSTILSSEGSSSEDVLEVSALNVEDQQQSKTEHETRTAAAVVAKSASATASIVELSSSILPGALADHLRELEAYAASPADPLHTDAEERLGRLLQEPFMFAYSLSSSSATASDNTLSATINPASVGPVVYQALETVRQAALRWAATQALRYTDKVASLDSKRAQSEEALVQLRGNMEDLLEEQRSLAEEMQDAVTPLSHEADSPSKSSLLLQERLTALTTRYARVLDAFYSDITRRQDTFYSVNGMLVEVDQFSEALLQRFEDNVHEMARLQPWLGNTAGALERQSAGTPKSRAPSVDISMMSPDPTHPQREESPFLARVLSETATPPHDAPCAAEQGDGPAIATPSAPSSSSTATTSGGATTPDRRALRERVHLLEKMLVEAKVQIAEASTMMSSAHRATSMVAAPSFQAQVWAAQDAKDFTHLNVAEEQLQILYGAAETTMHNIMTALRASEACLRETQGEMSQQLQTACVSVEESVRQRCRAEVERYEATVRSCNDSLMEVTRQQAREKQRFDQQLEQQRQEAANVAEKYARDVQQMRQSYTSEIEELTDHLGLLEEELNRTRQATQSAVKEAVERQTQLLSSEQQQVLRGMEKKLTRLMAEKVLLEERMTAKEKDGEQRLQVERDAVVRLQRRLDEAEGAMAEVTDTPLNKLNINETTMELLSSWRKHVSATADLYASQCTNKADWCVACVSEVLEEEREEWETEVMQLRERVAALLEKAQSTPAESCEQSLGETVHASPTAKMNSKVNRTRLSSSMVEDASSQALTSTPSPNRIAVGTSRSAGSAQSPVSPRSPARRRSSPTRSASTPAVARLANASASEAAPLCASAGTSPTRCRSPSLDSLELSTSLLRYSKKLSDQRTRNTERLERATALTAEVEDLLLRGAELTHLRGAQKHR